MISRRTPILLWRWIRTFGHPPPDLDFITDSLAVGGAFNDEQAQAMAARGVGAVLDMRSESQDDASALQRLGIRFKHLPTPDRQPPSADDLEQGSAWLLDQIAQGRKALVHCRWGIGRSVTVAAAVLVKQGHTWEQALQMIKARRWGAYPTRRQRASLSAFANRRR